MLIRIVRMTFKNDCIEQFLEIFERSKGHIRKFPGCRHLELLRDWDQENVFTTLSHWNDREALERYRRSDLFREVWAQTKPLFQEKPLAFSLSRFENRASKKR